MPDADNKKPLGIQKQLFVVVVFVFAVFVFVLSKNGRKESLSLCLARMERKSGNGRISVLVNVT